MVLLPDEATKQPPLDILGSGMPADEVIQGAPEEEKPASESDFALGILSDIEDSLSERERAAFERGLDEIYSKNQTSEEEASKEEAPENGRPEEMPKEETPEEEMPEEEMLATPKEQVPEEETPKEETLEETEEEMPE